MVYALTLPRSYTRPSSLSTVQFVERNSKLRRLTRKMNYARLANAFFALLPAGE